MTSHLIHHSFFLIEFFVSSKKQVNNMILSIHTVNILEIHLNTYKILPFKSNFGSKPHDV